MKEVWDYNVKIAKQAVKMGFQEIQFDYVRFPEGFEKRDDELTYGHGDYGKTADSNVQKRVHAVTDFVGYAKKNSSRTARMCRLIFSAIQPRCRKRLGSARISAKFQNRSMSFHP